MIKTLHTDGKQDDQAGRYSNRSDGRGSKEEAAGLCFYVGSYSI